MKSNKGVLTILANLAQLILQSRIATYQSLREHLDTLKTELQLLRSQLLPSTEIIHFLVQRHSFNLKQKITTFLKNANLEQLVLTISFSLAGKGTSTVQLAEMWRLAVVSVGERDVARESRAHELLFLIGRLFEQLNSRELFNDLIRNREASKNYIIDFQIKIKERDYQKSTLQQFGRAAFNSASIDNARELQICCYTNSKLLLSSPLSSKKIVYSSTSEKPKCPKNSLEATRGDSLDEAETPIRRKLISEQILLEYYDCELDLTILSSDSESLSPKQMTMVVKGETMEEFELLIEEKDKDQMFLEENLEAFNCWETGVLASFS